MYVYMYVYACVCLQHVFHTPVMFLFNFYSVMDRYEDGHYGCACPSISSITINIILCHVLYVNRKL